MHWVNGMDAILPFYKSLRSKKNDLTLGNYRAVFKIGAGLELAAQRRETSAGWQRPLSAAWVGRWSPGSLGTRSLRFLHPCALPIPRPASSSARLLGRVLIYGCFSYSAAVITLSYFPFFSHAHTLCLSPHSGVRTTRALCFRRRRSSEVDVSRAGMER